MTSLISKGRKPRFVLHLKIHDLINVPLVSGTSVIKWHLLHSIHAEHRGRTPKSPIANHRVDYSYSRLVPAIRIAVDRAGTLAECPIEFEVLQEFRAAEPSASSSGSGGGGGGGGREERVVLGVVRLNLSEYVEESEMVMRESGSQPSAAAAGIGTTVLIQGAGSSAGSGAGVGGNGGAGGGGSGVLRKRAGSAGTAGTASTSGTTTGSESQPGVVADDVEVEDGVVRRYLMHDSKINGTLKISILVIQTDGERNYAAPPLRTAPVFGGIAGILAGDKPEQQPDDTGPLPSISRSRDASEDQDMYRRVLIASWTRQAGELPADECIEDIFTGGDGWRLPPGGNGSNNNNSSGNSAAQTIILPSSTFSPRSTRRGQNAMRTPTAATATTPTPTPTTSSATRCEPDASRDELHHYGAGGGGYHLSNHTSTDTIRPSDFVRRGQPSLGPQQQQQQLGRASMPSTPSSASLHLDPPAPLIHSASSAILHRSNDSFRRAQAQGHSRRHSAASSSDGSSLAAAAAAAASGISTPGFNEAGVGGRRGGIAAGAFNDDIPSSWGGSDRTSWSRNNSILSMASRRMDGVVRQEREVDESEVRDDLVAWVTPEKGRGRAW